MGAALSELPLALFTTLAPMGAGAFVTMAIVLCTTRFEDEVLERVDQAMLVPFLVACAGFVASALHTANPAHGVFAFSGLGMSPLSNEISAGVVFMAVALVYSVMGCLHRLGKARVPFLSVVAVLGVVFSCFVGAAYMVPTIASWDTPLLMLEVVGLSLAGGSALAALVLAIAKAPQTSPRALRIVAVIGVLLLVASMAVHLGVTSGMGNAVSSGSSVVSNAMPLAVCGLLLVVASGVVVLVGPRWRGVAAPCSAAVVAAVGGVLARLSFYAIFLSVGVAIL